MSQITLGMHILRADGRVGVVTGWKVVAGTKVMYNLEVAQDHTFAVGVGMWVVHNVATRALKGLLLRSSRKGATSMKSDAPVMVSNDRKL